MRSTESHPKRRVMNADYRRIPKLSRRVSRQLSRRASLWLLAGAVVAMASPAQAARGKPTFAQWVESFRPRARARGVSDATYAKVMHGINPDTSVYALDRSQPEFTETLWQYLNRRVSDWRITEGRAKAKEYEELLGRIEQDFG